MDQLVVGDRALKVVGVLKPDVALFADCYLIPGSESSANLFPASDPSVQHATLVHLTPDQFRDPKVLTQLEAAYPAAQFAKVMPTGRLGHREDLLYLSGGPGDPADLWLGGVDRFLPLAGGSGPLRLAGHPAPGDAAAAAPGVVGASDLLRPG